MELLDAPGQRNGLRGRKPSMDLDAEVDVVANRVSVRADRLDGVANLIDMSLEVGDVSLLIEKRCQMAYSREPLGLGVFDSCRSVSLASPKTWE